MSYFKSERVDLHSLDESKCPFCEKKKLLKEMCSTKFKGHKVCLHCWNLIWNPFSTGKLPKNYKKLVGY